MNLIAWLVETAHPQKIILFGSAARREMELNSGLDIFAWLPSVVHRRDTALSIYRNLSSILTLKITP